MPVPKPARRGATALRSSAHRERRALRSGLAFIVYPFEYQFTAGIRHREEIQERVGGNPRAHLGAEYLDAVIAAGEFVDDILANRATAVVEPEPGLHRMLNRNANFNDFAAL